uniref:Uncharacterized protein n=1 Tax=Caenorhabditis japonica TaxID=281687 RepID=A0A8R1IPB9_CAEJA
MILREKRLISQNSHTRERTDVSTQTAAGERPSTATSFNEFVKKEGNFPESTSSSEDPLCTGGTSFDATATATVATNLAADILGLLPNFDVTSGLDLATAAAAAATATSNLGYNPFYGFGGLTGSLDDSSSSGTSTNSGFTPHSAPPISNNANPFATHGFFDNSAPNTGVVHNQPFRFV